MIDIHAHLLPETDDGARSLEESLALCRGAVADGTTTVVVTPHSGSRDGRHESDLRTAADVAARTAALQGAVDAAAIPLRLLPGAELFVDAGLLPRAANRDSALVTLAGSRYLLLEFPPVVIPPNTDDLLFRLQAAGYVPIIAHPERNLAIARQPALLYDWISRGCLAQLTAMSLTGDFGHEPQATAEVLLRHNLVQFLASDAHWHPLRPAGLARAVARAAELIGPERARAMVMSLPLAVLEDRELTGMLLAPEIPKAHRRWFSR